MEKSGIGLWFGHELNQLCTMILRMIEKLAGKKENLQGSSGYQKES